MDTQQFLSEFGHIARAQSGIVKLRQMIYQLAVTGALTRQEDGAEDAGHLLMSIAKERRQVVARKNHKRIPALESEVIKKPLNITIPANWRWSRLIDLGEINPRNDAPDSHSAAFVPMSGISQSHRAPIIAETRPWGEIKKGYSHFANGDVVLAKITPCFENGKAAVIESLPGDTGIGAGTTELQVFRPIHKGILPGYVYLFLRSPLFTVDGERNMTGSAGQKRVPTDYFATRAFPLPPTSEQARIVARVDELMSMCDSLEDQQQQRRKLQNVLRVTAFQTLANAQSTREKQESWQRINDNFHHLFTLPEDVGDLRRLINELAVQGVLTRQTDPDLPEVKGVAKIPRETSPSLKSERKEATVYSRVNDDEFQYKVPRGWSTSRLGELVRVINGRAFSKSELLEKGTPVLRVGNLFTSKDWYYSDMKLEEDKYCNNGDLIYAWSASFGPFIWAGPRVIFHYHIWKLENLCPKHISKEFLYIVLQERTEAIKTSGHGISMAHMTKQKMEQLPVAVPSLDEQNRIVVLVTELMRQCDEIEQHLRESRKAAERLAVSAVAALSGIVIEQATEDAVKVPQTELIAPLRLGASPDVKAHAPLASLLARQNGEMSARDLWQRFGGEIDAFYTQLKTEVMHGWIAEPEPAIVREKFGETEA